MHLPAIGLTHLSRHFLSSRQGLFKGLRTDAVEMSVAPDPVVEDFNVIEDIGPGQIPGFVDPFSDVFFFSELKNDSATAFFQQLPRRLILGVRLLARQKRCQS